MNLVTNLRTATLVLALLTASTTIGWAGCENKDRPATPTNLSASMGTVPGSALLMWRNNVSRTGLTYFDIYVRGPNNYSSVVTGGAGQHSQAGEFGQYHFHNLPSTDVSFAMRARTESGTNGCVSAATSEWVKLGPNKNTGWPGIQVPPPSR